MQLFFRCSGVNTMAIYPWIHQFSNNKRSADQIRPVYFPDVDSHSLPSYANFSMTAGDFQEIYTEPSKHISYWTSGNILICSSGVFITQIY